MQYFLRTRGVACIVCRSSRVNLMLLLIIDSLRRHIAQYKKFGHKTPTLSDNKPRAIRNQSTADRNITCSLHQYQTMAKKHVLLRSPVWISHHFCVGKNTGAPLLPPLQSYSGVIAMAAGSTPRRGNTRTGTYRRFLFATSNMY